MKKMFAMLLLLGVAGCVNQNGEYTAQQQAQVRDAVALAKELGAKARVFVLTSGRPFAIGTESYIGAPVTVFAELTVEPKEGGFEPMSGGVE